MATRRLTAGLLAGLVLLASCSGAPTTTTTAPAPPIQIVFRPFETTWTPADDVEQVTASARSELVRLGGSALVPVSLPPETDSSAGRLAISRRDPPGEVYVDVYITFTQDGHEAALSLSSYPADQVHPTCVERKVKENSLEAVEVRSASGCVFTNTVGLSFIEWNDGDRWYHVETFMQPDDAISWLTDWEQLP
ncbi:MAG TPA: hypothetical protein ENH00_10005 [Actinobacteria bacterium]|nr:hypothetical protein [Actinomycetota bacterium]